MTNAKPIFCYRVWMKDGYCGLYNGQNPKQATDKAIAEATVNIKGCAMTPAEKRKAVTVDYFENLTTKARQ